MMFSPLTYGIPDGAITGLHKALMDSDLQPILYPWANLEARLGAGPDQALVLVGYGSLLNPASAARTIRDTPSAGHPPVLAVGARRIFNYRIPNESLARFGVTEESQERAALNLDYTRDSSDCFNGRLIRISISDIAALRAREIGYDLVPVAVLEWGEWTQEPQVAYALTARNEKIGDQIIIDNGLLPNRDYTALCSLGAEMVSPGFLQCFWDTTFLADRKTTLGHYMHRTMEPSTR